MLTIIQTLISSGTFLIQLKIQMFNICVKSKIANTINWIAIVGVSQIGAIINIVYLDSAKNTHYVEMKMAKNVLNRVVLVVIKPAAKIKYA